MIQTKYLMGGVSDVPSMWCFGFYLKLPQELSGQDMMIKSVFNHKDRTPSMSLYVARRSKILQYRFYDHSTGYRGDKIDLVMRSFNLSFVMASQKIVEDYNKYVLENGGDGIRDYKEHNKYQVVEWKRRKWNILDRDYWTSYEIGSGELEHFQAWPLDWYRLDNGEKELIITGEYIYGYFTSTGELYKVYQPMVKDRKFLKIKQYIQGENQLSGKYDTLVITKSLKDIIVINILNIGVEAIAPDSEGSLLPEKIIADLKERYNRIIVLFDQDSAGHAGAEKYTQKYNIPSIFIHEEYKVKDVSDLVKNLGLTKTKEIIAECFNNLQGTSLSLLHNNL